MKNVFAVLLFCGVFAVGQARGEERDLILVAGQSNAVGYDAYANELPADAGDKDVLFWWRCGDPPPDDYDSTSGRKWTNLQVQPKGMPLSRGSKEPGEARYKLNRQYGNFLKPEGGFGPEIGLARELRAKQPQRPLAIVKAAFSGTSLRNDWNPADSGDAGACYRAMVSETRAAIAAAKEQGTTFKLRALVWVQGESDANASDSVLYERGMNEMLAALRKDLDAPQLIALLGVNTRFGNDKNPFVPKVVEAQRAVAAKDPRSMYVDTAGAETLLPSRTHFTAAGTLDIGKRFATALLQLESEGKTSGRAPDFQDANSQRYDLAKRACEIDPRAQEHSEIDFLFADKQGKVRDMQHATVDTRVAPQGRLVIWLMDHNAGLFERIAEYGLHGIQVHYANRWFSGLSQETLNDGVSLGRIRLEAATGEDHSPLVTIPQPDGLMERSLQFVKWLANEHPQGRWEQFLDDERTGLRWDKVTLSGISHGSTTAARLAIHQRVDRVVMFSGPRDQTENWQGFPSATPGNRFFGYTHVLDGGWTADHYCRSWELLGLQRYGAIVDVDDVRPPYADSRRLITHRDVNNDANRAHTTVVPGGSAVKNAEGRYVDEPVWRYLFNHPVEETGASVPSDPACGKNLR